MSHAQKPDFFFRRNGRVYLNQRGRKFSRLLAAELCASAFIVGSNAGYTMFRGSVKGTGNPFHSPVSPSLPLPCVTVYRHISTGVYPYLRLLYCIILLRVENSSGLVWPWSCGLHNIRGVISFARFRVVTIVFLKIQVRWNVILCLWANSSQRFE